MSITLNNVLNVPATLSLPGNASSGKPQFIIGRVTSIDLRDETYPATIQFSTVNPGLYLTGSARPMSINFKHYPIVDELVFIFPGPSPEMNNTAGAVEYYYDSPFALWSTNHTNEFPNLTLPTSQSVSYKDETVYNLRNFLGDIIVEGRYGNSIRFGSTSKNKGVNPWSKTGKEGDPVTVVSNGHKSRGANNWSSITEDIDKDLSSIWMTSTQAINIKDLVNFPLDSFYTSRAAKAQDTTQAADTAFGIDSETRSPAEQDGAPPAAQFVSYEEQAGTSKRVPAALDNQLQYAVSAQYIYYRRLLRPTLRAKDPAAYDLFNAGFIAANRAGNAPAYVQNPTTPFNAFLTPTEVQTALGSPQEYNFFISVVQNLIQLIPAFAQQLFGTIEGNIAVQQQNYGRRWDTLPAVTRFDQGGSQVYSEFWTYDRANNQFRLIITIEEPGNLIIGYKNGNPVRNKETNQYLEILDGVTLQTVSVERYTPPSSTPSTARSA